MIRIPATFYSVANAEYVTADNSAMAVFTTEAGVVIISEKDQPEAWAIMQSQSAIQIAPFVDRTAAIKPAADPNGGPDVVA